MIRYYFPTPQLQKLSERDLAQAASLSRGAIRQLLRPTKSNLTMSSIDQLAKVFNRDVEVVMSNPELFTEYSTVATAYAIERDGFGSWKTHLFNFVDEFRRTEDARLALLAPPSPTDKRIVALLASTVRTLCEEIEVSTPRWAMLRHFLPKPWFVAEMNSLKASALIETPLAYRTNNIFVLSNFLTRA